MNAIEKLKLQVEEVLPDTSCSLDPGEGPGAPWFLDCRRADQIVTVEWRALAGFGVSAGTEPTMEGPDEVYPDASDALSRVLSLLHAGSTGTVRALREGRSVTQAELAARMGISQPALSKLERRGDLQIGTLRRVAEHLGGRISVRVEFQDGSSARVEVPPRDMVG